MMLSAKKSKQHLGRLHVGLNPSIERDLSSQVLAHNYNGKVNLSLPQITNY